MGSDLREYKRIGWIYAARNPSFTDPVFKLGRTTVSPSERIAQLGASTSVFRKFELAYFVHVSDHLEAERFVHLTLQSSRLMSGKEFFGASIMTVVKVLDEAGERWPTPLGKNKRSGFLPAALTKRIVYCPKCNGKSRVPELLIDMAVTCTRCAAPYTVRCR